MIHNELGFLLPVRVTLCGSCGLAHCTDNMMNALTAINRLNSHIKCFTQEMFFYCRTVQITQENRLNLSFVGTRDVKQWIKKLLPSPSGLECSWNWLQTPSQIPWMTQHPRTLQPSAPIPHGCPGYLQKTDNLF